MMALYPSIGTTSSLAAISSQILTKATVAKKHIWRVVVLGVMRSNEYIFVEYDNYGLAIKIFAREYILNKINFLPCCKIYHLLNPRTFFPSKKGKLFPVLIILFISTPPTYDIFLVFSQIYFYPSTFEWLLSSFQRRYVIHVLRRVVKKKQVSLNWLW